MRNYIPKDWKLNPDRWKEIRYFAWQYECYKMEKTNISFEYRASMNGSIAVKSSSKLSTVEQKVDRMLVLDNKIKLIEDAVRWASESEDPKLNKAILISITTRVPLQYIDSPVQPKQLGRYRRRAIYYLNEKI